jgi:hypothetical protein
MSDYERNKGKLIPVGVDTENFSDEDFEAYTESGFAVIDGEVYEVQWDVERDDDAPEFADIHVNEDGSIDFHTYHYNGGAHWTEIIEDALL